jgi:hypothetical protein
MNKNKIFIHSGKSTTVYHCCPFDNLLKEKIALNIHWSETSTSPIECIGEYSNILRKKNKQRINI